MKYNFKKGDEVESSTLGKGTVVTVSTWIGLTNFPVVVKFEEYGVKLFNTRGEGLALHPNTGKPVYIAPYVKILSKNFELADRVISTQFGAGTVIDLNSPVHCYPIEVEFDNGKLEYYTPQGWYLSSLSSSVSPSSIKLLGRLKKWKGEREGQECIPTL